MIRVFLIVLLLLAIVAPAQAQVGNSGAASPERIAQQKPELVGGSVCVHLSHDRNGVQMDVGQDNCAIVSAINVTVGPEWKEDGWLTVSTYWEYTYKKLRYRVVGYTWTSDYRGEVGYTKGERRPRQWVALVEEGDSEERHHQVVTAFGISPR